MSETNLGKLTAFLELENKQFNAGMSQARTALQEFAIETQKTENALTKLANQTGVSEKVIKSFANQTSLTAGGLVEFGAMAAVGINQALGVLHSLEQVLHSVFELVESAARTNAAGEFFLNAGHNIDIMRKATKGLISDAELMKKVNFGEQMGIDARGMATLALVAHTAALKTGQSFDYMFDRIVQGTARGSRVILGHMGIMVSAREANEHYAESIKNSADAGDRANMTIKQIVASLSDEEKHHAFLNEVIAKSQGPLEQYAKVGNTAADNFDRLTAASENLKLAIGTIIGAGANSPIKLLAAALGDIADKLALIQKYGSPGDILKAGVSGVQSGINGAMGGALAAPFLGLLAPVVGALGFGGKAAIDSASDSAEREKNKQSQELIRNLNILSAAGLTTKDALTMSAGEINDKFSPSIALAAIHFQELNRAMGNPYQKVGTIVPEEGEAKPGHGKKLGEGTNVDFGASEDQWARTIKGFMSEADKEAAKEAHDREMQGIADEKTYYEQLEITRKEKLAAIKEAFDAEQFNYHKMAEIRAQDRADSIAAIGDAAKVLGNLQSGNAAGSIGDIGGIIGAFMGAPQMGKAIGDLVGQLIGPIKAVGDLFAGLASGITKLVQIGLGPLLDTLAPIGPAMEVFLAALGQVVQSALKPLLPVLILAMQGLAYWIVGVADAFIVLAPLVELFCDIINGGLGPLNTLFKMITGGRTMVPIGESFTTMANIMIDAAVGFNNAIVGMIRMLPGMADFGSILDPTTFEVTADNTAAAVDNTTATHNNTKAVRDLAREFRNLPQGYKVNYPIYTSQNPNYGRNGAMGSAIQGSPLSSPGIDTGLRATFRTRT